MEIISLWVSRVTAAIAVWFMWFKLIYWLRLFSSTSYYIRLIQDTIYDIRYFLLVYIVILGMFANAMHCLNLNRDFNDEDSTIIDNNFANVAYDAMLNQYLLSLGEFSLDNFGAGDQEDFYVIWLFFLLSTFLTSITILNMLIAIMGDTFGRVTEIRDQSALKEKILIISDFVFLVNV